MRKRSLFLVMTLALAARTTCGAQFEDPVQPRVVELTAGKDSRYRQGGKIAPTIEVSVGEHFILRITAFARSRPRATAAFMESPCSTKMKTLCRDGDSICIREYK